MFAFVKRAVLVGGIWIGTTGMLFVENRFTPGWFDPYWRTSFGVGLLVGASVLTALVRRDRGPAEAVPSGREVHPGAADDAPVPAGFDAPSRPSPPV